MYLNFPTCCYPTIQDMWGMALHEGQCMDLPWSASIWSCGDRIRLSAGEGRLCLERGWVVSDLVIDSLPPSTWQPCPTCHPVSSTAWQTSRRTCRWLCFLCYANYKCKWNFYNYDASVWDHVANHASFLDTQSSQTVPKLCATLDFISVLKWPCVLQITISIWLCKHTCSATISHFSKLGMEVGLLWCLGRAIRNSEGSKS